MTAQPEYKTSTNGMIDYRHYIHRSHVIRSNDAHNAIRKLTGALASVFGFGRGQDIAQQRTPPVALIRKPMRTSRLRRAVPFISQAEAARSIR